MLSENKKRLLIGTPFFLFILSFCFVAFAQDTIRSYRWRMEDLTIKIEKKEIPIKLGEEIVSKRTINSKSFLGINGSIKKEIYASVIHYLDPETNEFKDIDNKIVKSDKDGWEWMNTTNQFKTYFKSDPFSNNGNVRLEYNDSWIQIGSLEEIYNKDSKTLKSNKLDSETLKAQYKKDKTTKLLGILTILDEKKTGKPQTDKSKFVYEKIINKNNASSSENMNILYSVSPTELLEEIIIDKQGAIPKLIKQEISFDNSVPRLNENGGVDFFDEKDNKLSWFIPKPVMYELNNKDNKNFGIFYNLEFDAKNNQKVKLNKIIDQEGEKWLTDPKRNYPIVIDATVTIYPGTQYWAWKNSTAYDSWAAAAAATSTIFSSTDYTNVGTSDNNRVNVALKPPSTKYISMQYSFDLSGVLDFSTSTLPQAVKDSAACYDSTSGKIYIFGGYYDNPDATYSSSTVQYNPTTGTATTTNIGVLPVKLRGHSCASKDNDEMYIFGGYNGTNSQFNQTIYKFNPSSPSTAATTTGHSLPVGLEYAPAVYDSVGGKFYIFGGYYTNPNAVYSSGIVQYNPVTGVATTTGIGALPKALGGASAAYKDSNEIYIFGGYNDTNSIFNANIYSFDPSSPSTAAADTTHDLPSPGGRRDAAAVYDSNASKFYIFGGYYGTTTVSYVSDIVEYSPGSNGTVKDNFPYELRGSAVTFNSSDNKAYIFGGYDNKNSSYSDDILIYDSDGGYDVDAITDITFTNEGYYSTGTSAKLYYYADTGWNADKSIGTSESSTSTSIATTTMASYLDANNRFSFSAVLEATSTATSTIYTDLAKIVVTYTPPNDAPAFTAGPSDNGSVGTIPTNVGAVTTFSATSSDAQSDSWKLLVCSTSTAPTASTTTPTCAGGDGNKYCVSSGWVVADAENTCTRTAVGGDAESNAWYAFACDNNSGNPLCSSSSQGAGDNGSPFMVNHVPGFTNIADTPDPLNPGATVTFYATSSDTDTNTTADTVRLLVCKTSGVSSTACDGGAGDTWCGLTTATSSNPNCTSTVPTLAGSNNYYAYIFDNHDLTSTDNPRSSTFTVNNTTPTVGTISPTAVSLIESATTAASATSTVADSNGYGDITSVIAVFYDSVAQTPVCSSDNNDCYADISCSTSSCNDTQCTATCSTDVWYYANASDWKWQIKAIDAASASSTTISSVVTIADLIAIDVSEANIDYDSLNLGDTSAQATTTVENTGNTNLDVGVYGTAMSCSIGSIAVGQQKFNIGGGETALTGISQPIDLNVPQRTTTPPTDSIYWKLYVPSEGAGGTCSGINTFEAQDGG